jgi:hypothetical protein
MLQYLMRTLVTDYSCRKLQPTRALFGTNQSYQQQHRLSGGGLKADSSTPCTHDTAEKLSGINLYYSFFLYCMLLHCQLLERADNLAGELAMMYGVTETRLHCRLTLATKSAATA